MIINKNTSNKKFRHYGNFAFCRLLFSLKLVSSLHDFITSLHTIAKSSILLAKYFPVFQLHVEGLQIKSFTRTWRFLNLCQHLCLFHHWLELHFLPSNLCLHWHGIYFVRVFEFVYSKNHVEHANISIFCFIWNIYFSRQVIKSITTSNTSI